MEFKLGLLILLSVLVSNAYTLKCYECVSCPGSNVLTTGISLNDCPVNSAYCKTETASALNVVTISKSCASACNAFNNIALGTGSSTTCCTTDGCNTDATTTVASTTKSNSSKLVSNIFYQSFQLIFLIAFNFKAFF